MPGATNCEAVVVSGNVPSGFYTQQTRVFNSQGIPSPSAEVQMGVYTTGKAVLVVPSHTTITGKTATYTEEAARYTLNGTGATTPATVYEIYNRGFDSTAYGVASFDQSFRRNLGWSAPYWVVNHDNGYQYKMRNHLARIDTMTTSVGASGGFSTAIQKGKVRVDGKDVLAVVVPQPVSVPSANSKFDLLAFVQDKNVVNQMMLWGAQKNSVASIGGMNAFTPPSIDIGDAGYHFHNMEWRTSFLNTLKANGRYYGDNAKQNWSEGNYLAAGSNTLGVLSTALVGAPFEMAVPESYEGLAVQVGTAGIAKYVGFLAPKILPLIPAIKQDSQILVNQRVIPVLNNGYVEVNGFKFSKYYYQRLYDSGRRAPSLVATEILDGGSSTAVADLGKIGFYRYNFGGWEMSYNPITKEVWHLQPIK